MLRGSHVYNSQYFHHQGCDCSKAAETAALERLKAAYRELSEAIRKNGVVVISDLILGHRDQWCVHCQARRAIGFEGGSPPLNHKPDCIVARLHEWSEGE